MPALPGHQHAAGDRLGERGAARTAHARFVEHRARDLGVLLLALPQQRAQLIHRLAGAEPRFVLSAFHHRQAKHVAVIGREQFEIAHFPLFNETFALDLGTIRAEDNEPRGARFVVELPA